VIEIAGMSVVGLLVAKTIVHVLGVEFIALTGLVTAIIGGVTFTLSILFAGAIPDYKESEKIPGEIAILMKDLYKDIHIVCKDEEPRASMYQAVRRLVAIVARNFKEGTWKQHEMNRELDLIDAGIADLAENGAQPNYIIMMRNDVSAIERLSNRVETIKDTTFLPPAFTVARILVAMVPGMMIFVNVDPYYEAVIITAILGFLLVGLVFLIRDMDDPFKGHDRTFADVDFEHILKVQEYVARIAD
jgi:hypothetical protein